MSKATETVEVKPTKYQSGVSDSYLDIGKGHLVIDGMISRRIRSRRIRNVKGAKVVTYRIEHRTEADELGYATVGYFQPSFNPSLKTRNSATFTALIQRALPKENTNDFYDHQEAIIQGWEFGTEPPKDLVTAFDYRVYSLMEIFSNPFNKELTSEDISKTNTEHIENKDYWQFVKDNPALRGSQTRG